MKPSLSWQEAVQRIQLPSASVQAFLPTTAQPVPVPIEEVVMAAGPQATANDDDTAAPDTDDSPVLEGAEPEEVPTERDGLQATLPEEEQLPLSSRPPDAALQLALPLRKETTHLIRELMLLDVVQQWNFVVAPGTCCTYHNAIAALCDTLHRLEARKCIPQFLPIGDWQCRSCAVVGMRVATCEVCGREGSTASPRSEATEESSSRSSASRRCRQGPDGRAALAPIHEG